MNKPIEIGDKLPDDIYTGEWIIGDFYNQGYWHSDNIPRELKEKNWKPEVKEKYLVWHHHTNPSDPADQGEEILDYIEPINFFMDYIKSTLNHKIFEELNDRELLRLAQYLNIKNIK